jgi:hypothetical protein
MLVRKGNEWYAFEVKGTNSVKSQHITDGALQYAVITGTGLDLADFSIVHFNKEYVRVGDINVQELFTATSILKEIWNEQDFILEKISELKQVIGEPEIPSVDVGPQCEKPYPCNFSNYCFKDIPSVEKDIPQGDIQVHPHAVLGFINEVNYPLYFFDFETMMYGVPQYDYSRPWQQLPFQYSLHLQENPGASLTHSYFLGDGITDPREALIQQLIQDIGTVGSVVVYYKPFELARLKELALFFPTYAAQLEAISERVIDLIEPFKKQMVMIPSTQGSNSIKDVLPALVPELSYQNLNIQEGGTASFKYTQLAGMDEITRQQTRQDLLDYCELDTLAMVKIWEWLNNEAQSS